MSLGAALLLAASTSCAAPPPVELDGEYTDLVQGFWAAEDPAHGYTVETLTQPPDCQQFRALPGEARFGATDDGVWVMFSLPEISNPEIGWRLRVQYAPLRHVCSYLPIQGGGYEGTCSNTVHGDPMLTQTWAPGHVRLFPENLDYSRPILIYAESASWLKVPVEIGSNRAFERIEIFDQFAWGIYFGILLALVAYSGMVGMVTRDQTYLWFALHYAAFAVGYGGFHGRFLQMGLPAWSAANLALAALAAFVPFGVMFYRQFLNTAKTLPRIDRLLKGSAVLGLLAMLLAIIDPTLSLAAVGASYLLWFALVIAASILRARDGYRPAITVMAAMSVFLLGGALQGLQIIGALNSGFELASMLTHWGAALGGSVLVIGLGQRVREADLDRMKMANMVSANQRMALHRARYDDTTGLPNREKFSEDLRERLLRATAGNERLAVVTLGLDHFRSINHALGHDAGDAVLREIALRLRAKLHGDELLARIGPDIFGLVLREGAGQQPDLGALIDRCGEIQEQVGLPLRYGDGAKLGASIGVASFPDHGLTGELLTRHSDAALYQAKDIGGGALEMFQPELLRNADRHLRLSRELRSALERAEFQLYFQPIMSLQGDGELIGAEALIRWQRSDGSFVPPDQFIPVAESADLIAPISDWVFKQACAQLADWRRRGVGPQRLSVNISPRQFRLPGLADSLSAAMQHSGVPGSALDLEITEGVVIENLHATNATLERMRRLELGVLVDDFGVGFSSLSYLRSLPVTGLKIDRSFLRGIPGEAEANTVIAAMISLGRDLGLKVVAEGIEEQAQRDFLVERGCTLGQGFLFCKAMSAADLEIWLNNRTRKLSVA